MYTGGRVGLTIINAKRQCETCARLFPRVCRNEFTLAYYNVNSRLARAGVINSIAFCHAFVPSLPSPSPPNSISLVYISLGSVKKPREEKISFRFQDIRDSSPFRGFSLNIVSWGFAYDFFELLTRDNSIKWNIKNRCSTRLNLDLICNERNGDPSISIDRWIVSNGYYVLSMIQLWGQRIKRIFIWIE